MRLVVKKYASGGTFAVETTNDGAQESKELEGKREVNERISAYLEAACDDNEQGAERLLAALSRLTIEVEKRKKAYSEKASVPAK